MTDKDNNMTDKDNNMTDKDNEIRKQYFIGGYLSAVHDAFNRHDQALSLCIKDAQEAYPKYTQRIIDILKGEQHD